ncbi:MAG: glycosyltransferase family 2 protein [Saprospiraceae bacterium]|nr:glycosyltransferase family 2 protein [Saprospiraceae bacterium]
MPSNFYILHFAVLHFDFHQILLWLFVTATAVQLLFWLGIFSKLAFYRDIESSDKEQAPVSVIICARNEAENLLKNLPHFLSQNYRSFEIIVVNDHSTDKTCDVVLNFQLKFPNLRLIKNQSSLPGKSRL